MMMDTAYDEKSLELEEELERAYAVIDELKKTTITLPKVLGGHRMSKAEAKRLLYRDRGTFFYINSRRNGKIPITAGDVYYVESIHDEDPRLRRDWCRWHLCDGRVIDGPYNNGSKTGSKFKDRVAPLLACKEFVLVTGGLLVNGRYVEGLEIERNERYIASKVLVRFPDDVVAVRRTRMGDSEVKNFKLMKTLEALRDSWGCELKEVERV